MDDDSYVDTVKGYMDDSIVLPPGEDRVYCLSIEEIVELYKSTADVEIGVLSIEVSAATLGIGGIAATAYELVKSALQTVVASSAAWSLKQYMRNNLEESGHVNEALALDGVDTSSKLPFVRTTYGHGTIVLSGDPFVRITNPTSGDVSGTSNVDILSCDANGIDNLQFLVDGSVKTSAFTDSNYQGNYQLGWDTTSETNGQHLIQTIATDGSSDTRTSKSVDINVNNENISPGETYSVGGTVSGLAGSGLVLQNNGGDNLPVSAGATSFTFTTAIDDGATVWPDVHGYKR